MENGYSNPATSTPQFSHIRNKGVQDSFQKKMSVPSSFGNHLSYENGNNFSTVIDPSHCLPLLPHGGTRLAFGNNDESPHSIDNISHLNGYPALQLQGKLSETLNNQYEVPFSHYSSANSIMAKAPHLSFCHAPPPKNFSRTKPLCTPSKHLDCQNIADSLPSLIQASRYNTSESNYNGDGLNYVTQSSKTDLRTQPQGTSSSNSFTSNIGNQDVHLHISNNTSHLGNI